MPAILAGAQLFEDLDLVQALSMSTAVSTGPSESLAADRMLMSGQNSAIFDLALLAPGLISADSDSAIALTGLQVPEGAAPTDPLSTASTPVEMPTDAANFLPSITETPIRNTTMSPSTGLFPSTPEVNDAELTRALAALAALEQTGRSTLIPQKARPDLLPSILKTRLGIATPITDIALTEPNAVDPTAKLFEFASTTPATPTDRSTPVVDFKVAAPNGEMPQADLISVKEFSVGSASSSDSTIDSMPSLALNDVAISELGGELKPASVPAAPISTANFELGVELKTVSVPAAPLSSDSRGDDVDLASVVLNSSALPTVHNTVATPITNDVTSASGHTPSLTTTSLEETAPLKLSINTSSDGKNAPPIEEARRDERPAFIGELIETPKPIILPNQPMPVTPRTPFADPASSAQQPAFVFTNKKFAAPSHDAKIQDQNIVRIINNDKVMVPASITPEVKELVIENDHVKTRSADTKIPSEALTFGVLLGIGEKGLETPENSKTFDFTGVSNLELKEPTITTQPFGRDGLIALAVGKSSKNVDGESRSKTLISPENTSTKEAESGTVSHEEIAIVLIANDSLDHAQALLGNSIPLPLPSTKPQEPTETTGANYSSAGINSGHFTQIGQSKLSAGDKPDLSTSVHIYADTTRNIDADTMRNIEIVTAQQIAESGTRIETSSTTMSAPIQWLIKEFEKADTQKISMPHLEDHSAWGNRQPSSTETQSFAREDSTSDQQNSERDPTRNVPVNNHELDEGNGPSAQISEEDFGVPKSMSAMMSLAEEDAETKRAIELTIAEATAKSERDDAQALNVKDFDKLKIVVTEPGKGDINRVRNVTLFASHNEDAPHPATTLASFVSSPADYRSGTFSSSVAAAADNAVAPTYAAGDNPLFQIQRDRAVEAQVIAALKAGRNEVRVSLYPPQLGQVTINLALDGQKVKVALKTSNREATDLLTAEQPSLSHALQLEGFSLEGFDVTEDGPHDNRKEDGDQTIITPIPVSSGSSEFSIDITI